MDLSTKRLIAACLAVFLLTPAGSSPGAAQGAARSRAPRAERPAPSCFACLLIADDGRVLFARRASLALPNASTTKMVTALVVVAEKPDLNDEVRVSEAAASTPGGKLSLVAGEEMSVEDLLAVLMLNSSNDAAVALAEHVAGSVEAFADLMNLEASSLGATDTHFVTPHGLDSPGHVSTAADLALIGEAILDEPVLADLVGRRKMSITTSTGTTNLENTNMLLGSYRGTLGVKTGFTSDAGNVLVSAVERQDRRLIAVVMRSEDAFQDSRTLLDFGFARLARGILLARMTPMTDLVLDPGGAIAAVTARNVRGITDPDTVTVEFEPTIDLEAPVSSGDRVGRAAVLDDSGVEVGFTPVIAADPLEKGSARSWFGRTLSAVISGAASFLPGEEP